MSEYKLMKWSELEATLPPEARARIDARFRETMSRLRLSDIREAVGHTQVELAAQLKLGQASVSKIESAADMYLSTLRRYIEALGGELVVSASFPEGTVIPIQSLSSVPRRRRRQRDSRARVLAAKKSRGKSAGKSAGKKVGKQAGRFGAKPAAKSARKRDR